MARPQQPDDPKPGNGRRRATPEFILASPAEGAAMTPPETRYAKSGDVSIAYQVTGSGDLDLVFVPGFVSNLDFVRRVHSNRTADGAYADILTGGSRSSGSGHT